MGLILNLMALGTSGDRHELSFTLYHMEHLINVGTPYLDKEDIVKGKG